MNVILKKIEITMSKLIPNLHLTEEKREFIKSCRKLDENVFLEGPPWSGKSLFCLYNLRELVKENNTDSLFLVSNNAMYGYMSIALKELEISENVSIDSKNKFFWKIASDYGIRVNLELNYFENYDSVLTQLLNEEIEREYGVAVVSEVQDYLPKEWELIKRMARKVVCYGDFKQAIYSSKIEREAIIADCVHKRLNYRENDAATNRLREVRKYFFDNSACVAMKDEKRFTLSGESSIYTMGVEYIGVDAKYENELMVIAEKIKMLEGQKSRVAIICPANDRFDELSAILENRSVDHIYYEVNSDLRHHDFTSTRPLLISVFNAEWLQFDNVILFGFDESNYLIEMKRKENRLRNMLYVGMTRARKTTYIIRNEETVKELKEFDL